MRFYPLTTKFKITSPFGERNPPKTQEGYGSTKHVGIDFGGGIDGKDCVACENARVGRVSYSKSMGNWVWLETDSGFGLAYLHMKDVVVKQGQLVTAKQLIGHVGNTGNSSGPHLHFGVAKNKVFNSSYYANEWINPAIYLGMQDAKVGTWYDGSGIPTGYPEGTTSLNNTAAVSTESGSQSQNSGYLDEIVPSGEFYQVVDLKGTLGDWIYGRKYRVMVDIGGGKIFDVSELRCTFQIIKTAIREPNQSILTIYNLSPEDENKLIQNGQRIIIEAGYSGSQYGMIFSGNIIQALRSKENGVDYTLTLVSMDSERYVTYGLIGVSLVAQQTARDAVNALLTKSSFQAGAGFLTDTSIKYPRGKVMFGQSTDFLEQISVSQNATYYTDDGKVNIVTATDVGKNKVLSFGPQTGLIGSPIQNELGIECDLLLNPHIQLNSLFHVDNKKVQNYRYTPGQPVRSLDSEGLYRVIKLTHEGDTRGEEWTTHVQAISQAGLLPGMIGQQAAYTW